MDTISLEWSAVTGHYRVPGAVETMGTARCYPFCPPSTMAGAVESLCGREFGDFRATGSEMALGWIRRPVGRGALLRREQGFANPQEKIHFTDSGRVIKENWRPVIREVLFLPVYRCDIRGPYVELIRKALKGEVDRHSVLSLGDSDDMVDWICETDKPAEWLIPGNEFILPVRVHRSWDRLGPVTKGFQLSETRMTPPDEAWITPGGAV